MWPASKACKAAGTHLDLGELQEVLGHMDGNLVKEGGGDVEAVLNVVEVARCTQTRRLVQEDRSI